MEITTEDFLNSFHGITGVTIGERRKNLFSLLNRTKQLNFSNINFDSLKPKTALEESFKLQTLFFFEKIPNLIEVLKSENPKLIHQVLNDKFLKHLFGHVDETQLVEECFPQFSFNTKVKLINKLSVCVKDEKQGDALFAAIEKKYGFYLATKLLPCCSSDLILQCLLSLKFELTPRQLLQIVKKHPHLTEQILKSFSQYTDAKTLSEKYKIVFGHLLRNDLPLFLKLQEYQSSVRIGWRSTHKVVTDNKDIVARNVITFYKLLHAKQITKSFTTDFSKFYLNMFPPSLSHFKKNVTYYVDLLKHHPRSAKLNLLLSAFQETYGGDFFTYRCVHKSILELMSIDERESWMNSHAKPDYVSEEVWICLMKTEKSIPALKERISSNSNIKERAELVGCLIETCRINNDEEALLDVSKYVLNKHRNDNSAVLLSFLTTLKDCYDLNNLSNAVWKSIIDFLNHFMLRDEVTYQHNEWILSYIDYLIVQNQLGKEEFVSLLKKVTINGPLYWYMTQNQTQKMYLVTLGDVLLDVHYKEELKDRSVQFLQDVLMWNHKHPKDQISLLPYQSIIKYFIEKNKNDPAYRFLPIHAILQILRSDTTDQIKKEFLESFLHTDCVFIDVDMFLWFIKRKPKLVDEYLSRIVNIALKLKPTVGCVRFWASCCNYSHLNFPRRITDLCLDLLKNEDLDKKNVVVALSCLMQPDQFVELIKAYYPSDSCMDVNSEDQDLYKMQQGIMISLKNVIPPSTSFDSILRFSKGDYMKYVQRTLHSVCHSASENNLNPLFSSFLDHPVSVRKHSIYQTFKVSDKTEIFSMLNRFKLTEKNSSILKLIFKGTFNYFIKNPNDYLFDLVKEKLDAIDVCDEEAFEILLNKKVPVKFLPEFLVFSYNTYEKLPEGNAKQEGKTKLLNLVTAEMMAKLPEDFSWSVVGGLFKESTGFGDAVQTFSCRFLAYSVNGKVGDIFGIVKNLVASWNNEKIERVARKQIHAFVDNLCLLFIKDKNAPKQRFKSFVSLWNAYFKVHEAFHEYLKMHFTLCFLEGVPLSDSIFQLCDRSNQFDCIVAVDIAQILNSYLSYFLHGEDDIFELNRLDLIKTLVKSEKRLCVLLAISLLPSSFPDTCTMTESFEDVVQSLKNFKDPVICLYYSSYLHNSSLKNNTSEPDDDAVECYKSLYYIYQFTNKYRQ
ncbi:hypothetical protein RN001_003948 [Aquatica leii]|uniref:Uncharacterized protein n=1 Tax=Aquatica leii TaxID=1421715 RepID=A0AAN7QA08_9COLE|nr:hypothetical protein RN001_003948 [Aquatica leii]